MLAELAARLVGVDEVVVPTVVACSGGPDSLALLALAATRGWEPTAVHVDHGLRPTGRRESELVAGVAERLGVGFAAETASVAPGPNLEARARAVRYAALERARARLGAHVVLVGHTADDLAETVLLNVVRGSASRGLAGMPVARDRIVRPMLALRRAETERLCTELGLDPVRDPTNDDLGLRRNWVRHRLLPQLGEVFGRDLVPVLARQAGLLREESDYLDALARAAWPPGDATPAAPLAAMPPVLARRAVRQWLGPPPPSRDEVARVLEVARGERRATELSGGRRVTRRAGGLHVADADPGPDGPVARPAGSVGA